MSSIGTDYLVVGAGATGMAFTDTLVGEADVDVVMVDRRHSPGGHWNDDYPFVRLHQPSALYGVVSRTLGADRIDTTGANAGCYERATAAELCDYYGRVLHEQLLPSGKVRFLGNHDHLGADDEGHRLRSRLTGEVTTVRVRKRLVDATHMESSLPSTHTPSFGVHPDVRLVTPNGLVDLDAAPSGFTVIGSGKTAMDTCCWLVDNGVVPDAIRWIRPRDAWTNNRDDIQPLSLVGRLADWLARQNEASAEAEDLHDLMARLEDNGSIIRLDPAVEPTFFRGAILSAGERATLRSIENVVRLGKVARIGRTEIELDHGSIPTDLSHVHIDCTAAGLGAKGDRPVFEDGRVTLQWVQAGIAPFSAALIGYVEANRDHDDDRNRLCPPNGFTPKADARNLARTWAITQRAVGAWMAEDDVNDWMSRCRLSPLGNIGEYLAEPVMASLLRMWSAQGAAVENLERILAEDADADASA
ncbi:MAG: NAD(P)-binding protein [Acidimicrobiales bacterium]